jgi:hypothetical protein
MFVLREIEVVLYISTITEFWLSEVKPPITYTPLSKFREVPSVHGLGIGGQSSNYSLIFVFVR